MQQHTVQQIIKGRNEGKYVYTGGNRRMGRYIECCDGGFEDEGVGHATEDEAYRHMRQRELERLHLDVMLGDWSGCRAPMNEGGRCDVPTKGAVEIPPCHFLEPLCDLHRTRETVEAMWPGPGDWSGSW
jgi:hypothetical protein